METQQQNIRSWDDLIFENRNKAYGAYAIRQDYSSGLTKGAFTGLGILVSLIMLAGFAQRNASVPPIDGTIISCPFSEVPNIIPLTQRHTQPPARRVTANLPPVAVVTPDPVQPEPEPAAVSPGSEGTTEGTTTDTGATTGVPTGETGLGVVEEPKKEPFTHVEVMPSYEGGFQGMMTTLKRNMRYPASARRTGKEGTAYVEFVVNDAGDITDVKLLRGFDTACDKEAVRVVSLLTEWNPGYQNKVPVNVKLVLPVKFQLEK